MSLLTLIITKKFKENHNYSLKDTYLNVDKTYSI